MQADSFYQKGFKNAQVVILLTKAEWDEGLGDVTPAQKSQLQAQSFSGMAGNLAFTFDEKGFPLKAYVGLGDAHPALGLAEAALKLPPGRYSLAHEDLPSLALLSWGLAQYRFDNYKKQDQEPRILCLREKNFDRILAELQVLFFVRDLINKPANELGPEALALVMADLAKDFSADFQQWVGNELLSANFPAIHAVGRAAKQAPRFLSLNWGHKAHPKLCLIGKGVCFDSGGLDLKPAINMRLMKKDMAGAAHVLGLARWIMSQNLPINLQVLVPAVENAVSSDAFRPGDIIRMRNGLSVEIDNTDAEGRLILADALAYAAEFSPELIIDFATLTGAARVALGPEIVPFFTPEESLAQSIMEAAREIEEPVWRLPLYQPYETILKSSVADLVNSSDSPYAGAITAGLFLQRFVPKGLKWLHFDIMAWNLNTKPGKPEGGEVMGLRTIAHYIQSMYLNRENS